MNTSKACRKRLNLKGEICGLNLNHSGPCKSTRCAALVPEPGQWNLSEPALQRCRYRAPFGDYCNTHRKMLEAKR